MGIGTSKECQIKKNMAILDVSVYNWAINADNEDELFFDYRIYNYGDTEGKNIVVECSLYDDDFNKLATKEQRFGNLASSSLQFSEITTDTPNLEEIDDDTMVFSLCYIKSCKNCDILYKRIPDLDINNEG